MIIHDARNPRAAALREALERDVPGFDPEGLHVVIGGDGFLLQTVGQHREPCAFLGLNAGTVGFLLNDVDEWPRVVDRLSRGAWVVQAFPLLEATISGTNGDVVDLAMNDVYLERMTGQTARVRVTVDQQLVVDPLVADGFLLSTALGSTGYGFSAGGPACHPLLPLMTMTAICPHHPRMPPCALPLSSVVVAEVVGGAHRPVRAVVDGRELDNVSRVEVRLATQTVRLALLEGHDFTSRMVRKILTP